METVPGVRHKRRRLPSTAANFDGDLSWTSLSPPLESRGGSPVVVVGADELQRTTTPSPPLKSAATVDALPVLAHAAALVRSVKKHQVTIIVSETGSGKSTQVPQLLMHSPWFAEWGHRRKRDRRTSAPPHAAPRTNRGPYDESGGASDSPAPGTPPGPAAQRGVICVTQPRKVAATSLARRVASELQCSVGGAVGYKVRFDNKCSASTQIVYATDGIVVRESLSDPLLRKYAVIVLDEAHDRSLQTDLLLGIVHRCLKLRSKLRVVVMSATINVAVFMTFFEDFIRNVVPIPGRLHPIRVFNLDADPPADSYLAITVATLVELHLVKRLADGDFLVFLPGVEAINFVARRLQQVLVTKIEALRRGCPKRQIKAAIENASTPHSAVLSPTSLQSSAALGSGNAPRGEVTEHDGRPSTACAVVGELLDVPRVLVLRLHASLPQAQQQRVFENAPPGFRKIILATNIAETSLTIDNVATVLDSGRVNIKYSISNAECLKEEVVARNMAKQRAGRSGRQRAGEVYRMYTAQTFSNFPEEIAPEITRCDLSQVILLLKVLGYSNVAVDFKFVQPPEEESIQLALLTLRRLGALTANGDVTDHGRQLNKLPLPPVTAKFALESLKTKCTKQVLSIIAMLTVDYWLTIANQSSAPSADGDPSHNSAGSTAAAPTAVNNDELLKEAIAVDSPSAAPRSDHITLLRIFNIWTDFDRDRNKRRGPSANDFIPRKFVNTAPLLAQASKVFDDLKQIMLRQFVHSAEPTAVLPSSERATNREQVGVILKTLASSYYIHWATLNSDKTSYGLRFSNFNGYVHPTSTLWTLAPGSRTNIVFNDAVQKNTTSFFRVVSAVDVELLMSSTQPLTSSSELMPPPRTQNQQPTQKTKPQQSIESKLKSLLQHNAKSHRSAAKR